MPPSPWRASRTGPALRAALVATRAVPQSSPHVTALGALVPNATSPDRLRPRVALVPPPVDEDAPAQEVDSHDHEPALEVDVGAALSGPTVVECLSSSASRLSDSDPASPNQPRVTCCSDSDLANPNQQRMSGCSGSDLANPNRQQSSRRSDSNPASPNQPKATCCSDSDPVYPNQQKRRAARARTGSATRRRRSVPSTDFEGVRDSAAVNHCRSVPHNAAAA